MAPEKGGGRMNGIALKNAARECGVTVGAMLRHWKKEKWLVIDTGRFKTVMREDVKRFKAQLSAHGVEGRSMSDDHRLRLMQGQITALHNRIKRLEDELGVSGANPLPLPLENGATEDHHEAD